MLLRRDELPDLERVFVFDRGEGLDHDFVGDLEDLDVLAAEELAEHPSVIEDRAHAISGDDLATIVYTSGTTGRPKGAMLTHGNIAANLDNITSVVPIGPDDRFLSFLPLSHIAERTVSDFGQVLAGAETWFAESLASVQEDLQACRPTIFFAVPRVWEKFREGVREKVETLSPPQRMLAERYLHLVARKGRVTGSGPPLTICRGRPVPGSRRPGRANDPRRARARQGPPAGVRRRAGAPRPAALVRRPGPPRRRGLRPDRELRSEHPEPAGGIRDSAPSGGRSPGSRSASPTTGRSSSAART